MKYMGSRTAAPGRYAARGLERGPQRRGVADQGDTAVVGRVQPLVGVGRPGVRRGHARHLGGGSGRRRRPEPEGAVHVNPGVPVAGRFDERAERIAGPAVDVARLQAHDRLPRSPGRSRGTIRPWASAGSATARSRPRPTSPSALRTVACTSAAVTTVTGGAPIRPCPAASQPVPGEGPRPRRPPGRSRWPWWRR